MTGSFSLSLFVTALLITLTSLSAQAAKVDQVKGKKVLIILEGSSAKKGDLLFAQGPDGKNKGAIKISSVKGDKAVGILGKGEAKKGWKLISKPASSAKAKGRKSDTPLDRSSPTATYARSLIGVMGGYAMQSMDADVSPSQTAKMSGTGFSGKILFDYEMFNRVWFRATSGGEIFNVKSSDNFCGGQQCKVNITFFTADFWGRYTFSDGAFRPWAGAGLSLVFPISKEATALSLKSITNNNLWSVGGGFDYFTSPTFSIPVQFEYAMFPNSKTVSANFMAIRFGLAFHF